MSESHERASKRIDVGVTVNNEEIVIRIHPHEYMRDCKKANLRVGNLIIAEVAYIDNRYIPQLIEFFKSLYGPAPENKYLPAIREVARLLDRPHIPVKVEDFERDPMKLAREVDALLMNIRHP